MAYASQEARQDLLASIAEAIDELGRAMAALGDAYDQLDEHTADVLEEQLFRPAQAAYARAQRTHSGFAERHGLEGRTFAAASSPLTNTEYVPGWTFVMREPFSTDRRHSAWPSSPVIARVAVRSATSTSRS